MRKLDWRERLQQWASNPTLIDGLYLGGVALVVGLAGYILAFG